MKTLAVISDIHANRFALEAVIDDLAARGVTEVFVAGDLIGRGPQGSAVVSRIRALGWPCLRGNHEDYVLNFVHGHIKPEWRTSPDWSAARWMADELDRDHVAFLDALPMTMTAGSDASLRLYHGSPDSYQDGIGDWTSPERLTEHLDAITEDTLVCGHTHRPFHHRRDHRQIVNIGSVGLPFNEDWRAQYATFTQGARGDWSPRFHQVAWDRESFLKHYRDSGFLTEGGATTRLLYEELQHARPYLVPFLTWAKARRAGDLDPAHIPAFLNDYRDAGSSRALLALLASPPSTPEIIDTILIPPLTIQTSS
jgi:predicted phosphodiesterase